MSILSHPAWPSLEPLFYIEYVGRDPRQENGQVPRFRIEVRDPPNASRAPLLALTMPCVACGRLTHPIRARTKGGTMYFAATCEAGLKGACSKGAAPRREYAAVKAALDAVAVAPPPMLF